MRTSTRAPMAVDARGHLPESKRGPPPDDGDVLAAGPGEWRAMP